MADENEAVAGLMPEAAEEIEPNIHIRHVLCILTSVNGTAQVAKERGGVATICRREEDDTTFFDEPCFITSHHTFFDTTKHHFISSCVKELILEVSSVRDKKHRF